MKMLEPSRYASLRIDKEPFNHIGGVVLAIILYIACICTFLGIGSSAPNMFIEKSTPRDNGSASLGFTLVLTPMERLNELIYMKSRLQLPIDLNEAIGGTGEIQVPYTYTVNVWGSSASVFWSNVECPNGCASCPQGDASAGYSCTPVIVDDVVTSNVKCKGGAEWCTWVDIMNVDFVRFVTYYIKVSVVSSLQSLASQAGGDTVTSWLYQVDFSYMNPDWVRFQTSWYYAFLLLSVLMMVTPRFGFFYEVSRINRRLRRGLRWSKQQQWTGALLGGLALFNNPFFARELTGAEPQTFANLYTVFFASYIALLLIYWLTLLDDVVVGSQRRFSQGATSGPGGETVRRKKDNFQFVRQHGGKIVNVFMVWVFIILVRVRVRLNAAGMTDSGALSATLYYNNAGINACLIAFTSIYTIQLFWLTMKALRHLKRSMMAYVWVFVMGLFTAAFVIFVLCSGAMSKNHYDPILFCSFYGSINIYAIALSFFFTPTGSYTSLAQDNPIMRASFDAHDERKGPGRGQLSPPGTMVRAGASVSMPGPKTSKTPAVPGARPVPPGNAQAGSIMLPVPGAAHPYAIQGGGGQGWAPGVMDGAESKESSPMRPQQQHSQGRSPRSYVPKPGGKSGGSPSRYVNGMRMRSPPRSEASTAQDAYQDRSPPRYEAPGPR